MPETPPPPPAEESNAKRLGSPGRGEPRDAGKRLFGLDCWTSDSEKAEQHRLHRVSIRRQRARGSSIAFRRREISRFRRGRYLREFSGPRERQGRGKLR